MEALFTSVGIAGLWLLGYVSVVFIIARLTRDNSVMDIAYGPAFLVAALGAQAVVGTSNLSIALTALIAVWAIRLSVRIWRKNHGKPEDARYAAWRTQWMKKGVWYFWLRSYLQINVLQGLIILVVLLPFLWALTYGIAFWWPFGYLGLAVSICGLLYETIADAQLDAFLARKRAGTEPATIMTAGLFRFSRRPNYFGEVLVWWGQAITVLTLPFGWVALLGPALITFIVTKVTGPMLEDIFLEKYPTEYRAYTARTSYFIPWFPKPPRDS